MTVPYIGVADVPSQPWLAALVRHFVATGKHLEGRRLQAGVMMSQKTLNGLPTNWTRVWPKIEEVSGIFMTLPFLLNALHYIDYKGVDPGRNLARAVDLAGASLDVLELDMCWPEPDAVCQLARAHPRISISLQIGDMALERADDDADTVIGRLAPYGDAVKTVIIDRSLPDGGGLDAAHVEPFIYEIRARRPDLAIAVAGGIGPETLRTVEPLVRKFPGLSIASRSHLRASGSSQDPVELDRAKTYLSRALEMFADAG